MPLNPYRKTLIQLKVFLANNNFRLDSFSSKTPQYSRLINLITFMFAANCPAGGNIDSSPSLLPGLVLAPGIVHYIRK